MKLPESYELKMKKLLGNEFDDYIKSFDEKRYYGIRANTLKITPDELQKKLDFKLEKIQWCKEGFYYSENDRPAKHPYYNAGLYYIQEPSAMSTGAMIDIQPGDKVLDLCAAPGGKSTQAAAKLENKGVIISNDISSSRCRALLRNIETAGIKNAIVTNETPERLAQKFKYFFDKIIVDAPCSGEGMFRKDKDSVKSWEEHKTEFCCNLQRNILENAEKMLCDGGIIAYSTCTFAPEEDEGMINEFLCSHPNFDLIEVDKSYGFDKGKPEWIEEGKKELEKCGRLWPHKIKGEGHFLALLKKNKEKNKKENKANEFKNVSNTTYTNKKNLVDYYNFIQSFMNTEISEKDGNFIIHGQSLIKVPLNIDLSGLRVIRSGFYIGDIKKKRFEPSQAFAMGLKKNDVKNIIDFSLDDQNLIKYLKGESFIVDAEEGWNLICVDSFPLGWGKVQKNRLKNKYLPSWRI